MQTIRIEMITFILSDNSRKFVELLIITVVMIFL
jgi:hypothetical protein